MTKLSIQALIMDACRDHGDVSFRNDYSGRGMYGRTCIGIVGTRANCQVVIYEVMRELIDRLYDVAVDGDEQEASNLRDEVHECTEQLIKQSREDSMGLDLIVYWPNIEPLDADAVYSALGMPTDQQIHNMNAHELVQWIATNDRDNIIAWDGDGQPSENDLHNMAMAIRNAVVC